jgi:hypothetical protein
MKIDRIYYQRNFPIGQFLFETIGISIAVNEGEDAEQALDEAKRLVCEYNEKHNPHLQQADAPLPPEPAQLPVLQVDRPPVDMILDGIMNAKDGSDLSGYKLLIKNRETWTLAYQKRAKELGIIG